MANRLILSLEVKEMSPKELVYIEDALGHEQFLKTTCQETAQKLQDEELRSFVNQMYQKHQELFTQLYQLV